MALNRREIALNDLAKKIRLETQLKRKMNVLFRKISRDMRTQFERSGTVLQASQFKKEIRDLLKDQYNRTFKVFAGRAREGLKFVENTIELKQVEDSIVNRSNEQFAESQSQVQAEKITQTNQKRINAAILAAILAAQEVEGVVPTRAMVARQAQRDFLSDADSRATATSITETQNPAETSKTNQMNALLLIGTITAFNTKKVWTAIIDNVVRDAHLLADGQTKLLGEPYIVNGELLMHPGDTSLGASAGNVINCRCSSSLTVVNN